VPIDDPRGSGARRAGGRGAVRWLRPPDTLGGRLFAAQALVVLTGALTLVMVAVVTAPGLFREHLRRAGVDVPAVMAHHLNEALAAALLVSLTAAVALALLTTLAVTWLTTRRLGAPIARMAWAAARIADGDYEARVPPSRLGAEFAVLDNSFNRMAAGLQVVEVRRRELLGDLAHELRTPIASVDSFLEGLEDEVIPATAGTWRTMREQTARLRRLADDVDNLSRAEERRLDLDPRPVAIDDIAAEAVRGTATAFATKGVTVTHRRGPDAARVRADPDRLREIFDNLLDNAVRHTPHGGAVTIATTVRAGEVESTVTDTGDGIAAAHLPHVFDRFYRADPARGREPDHGAGGSGIGLTIARALARAHGGTLRAASGGPGRGARFTLTLPRARTH
jgi:two-component system sensor histidine kinase BaeS